MKALLLLIFKRLFRLNRVQMACMLALVVIGVFFIYSACYISDKQPVRQLYQRQILWAMAGVGVYGLLALIDYTELTRLSWWAYAFSVVLLIAVLLFGTKLGGARRWLFGRVQPSEFAKLATILVMAHLLGQRDAAKGFGMLLRCGALVLIPFVLIVMEPDIGTAVVLAPTVGAMMLVAGVAPRAMLILGLLGLLLVAFILTALMVPEKVEMSDQACARWHKATLLSSYQRDRLTVFLFPDKDPLGKGWNKRQSEIAVGSGGVSGKGFLQGTQNILGFLPRSVAPTDFIYSVIAEEKGFVGSVTVLILFGTLVASGLAVGLACKDTTGRLLCVGVTTLIFVHAFINIAMTVGLMPITGLPLPLLSYGGSFMLSMMAALGLIQSVAVHGRTRRMF